MRIGSLSLAGSALMFGSSLPLQAFTSPTSIKAAGQQRLTGALILQDAEYETAENFDVEGPLLGVAYKTGIGPKLSLAAGAALFLDGEINDRSEIGDGTGFRLMFEGDYEVKTVNNNRIFVTFGLLHDRFEFEENNANIDFIMTDIRIGGLVAHQLNPEFAVYGGLDVFAYSDGELEAGNFNVDAERGSRVDLRLGGAFAVDTNIDLRADLLLFNQQTLTLAADFSL